MKVSEGDMEIKKEEKWISESCELPSWVLLDYTALQFHVPFQREGRCCGPLAASAASHWRSSLAQRVSARHRGLCTFPWAAFACTCSSRHDSPGSNTACWSLSVDDLRLFPSCAGLALDASLQFVLNNERKQTKKMSENEIKNSPTFHAKCKQKKTVRFTTSSDESSSDRNSQLAMASACCTRRCSSGSSATTASRHRSMTKTKKNSRCLCSRFRRRPFHFR